MGNFKKNPERPFVVRIPNKIRKRIAMHETDSAFQNRIATLSLEKAISRLKKLAALPVVPTVQKKGSLWSRFTGGIRNFVLDKTGRKLK